jgi:hypothetical protein
MKLRFWNPVPPRRQGTPKPVGRGWRRADVPAYGLKTLKTWRGAAFIKQMGFRTEEADALYGKDWLERD